MTAPGCEAIREDLDAWAIGALDAPDARTVDRHVASCTECGPHVDAAREAAAALALSVPLEPASSSLKARVMAGAAVLDEPRRPFTMQRFWPLATAAGFTLFAAAAVWGITTQQELDGAQDDSAALAFSATEQSGELATADALIVDYQAERQTEEAMVSIVASGDATGLAMAATAAAPAASGAYIWSRTAGRGALVVSGLPPLPTGKSYCLWLVYERDWVVGGQFDADGEGSGRVIVEDLAVDPEMAGPLEGYAVTIENAGDVTKHEGETVLEASIAR